MLFGPIVATDLFATTGSTGSVALVLIGLAVVSLLCTLGLPETRDADFSDTTTTAGVHRPS